ncbi:MAG: TonB-dependent receptor plug domain-containing protein [Bacteroidales bacterium]|nr:TonB-dependent receptor plug domain-containing protein [Bacteroidales bacterium]
MEVVDQTVIDIKLIPDITKLDEVVVIGYGTVRRSDLTGSVSSISADDYKKEPVTNVSQALQGRVPGVIVSNNSGAPGSNIKSAYPRC